MTFTGSSIALIFFITLLLRVLNQHAACKQVYGDVWAGASPQVYFPNGFLQGTGCSTSVVTNVHARGKGLQSIEMLDASFSSLMHVDIRDNSITEVPVNLFLRSALHLHLAGNPAEHVLRLRGAQITEIPQTLLRAYNNLRLRELDVSFNSLGDLSQLKPIARGLQHLNISNNEFLELPSELPEIFPSLISLDCSENGIQSTGYFANQPFDASPLGHSIEAGLTTLRMENVGLSRLPGVINAIEDLTISPSYPEVRWTSGTVPSDLSPQLLSQLQSTTTLDIQANTVSSLPAEFFRLPLRVIDLADNPDLKVDGDWSLLEQSVEALGIAGTAHREIPDVVYSLTRLQVLDVEHLHITKIDPVGLAQLTRLRLMSIIRHNIQDWSWTQTLRELPELVCVRDDVCGGNWSGLWCGMDCGELSTLSDYCHAASISC